MVDFEHFSQTTCSSEQLKMNMSDKMNLLCDILGFIFKKCGT